MRYLYLLLFLCFPFLSFAKVDNCAPPKCKDLPPWARAQLLEDFSYYTDHPQAFCSAKQLMKLDKHNMAERKLVRIIVKNQKVTYKINDENTKTHVHRLKAIQKYFNRLAQENPDLAVDIVFSLHDYLDTENFPHGPVFVFAKQNKEPLRVTFPDPEALEGNTQFLKEVQEAKKIYPWPNKSEKAVFRGSMTGKIQHDCHGFTYENFLLYPRSICVTKSLQHPDLIDARFSAITQTSQQDLIATAFKDYFSPPLSVRDQLQYKYQILIDGNTCAYSRFFWQLFSDALIIKQASPNIQWFYKGVKPYVHFLPCKSDISDLPSQVIYARQNEALALTIIQNANAFAEEALTKKAIKNYVLACLECHRKASKQRYQNQRY